MLRDTLTEVKLVLACPAEWRETLRGSTRVWLLADGVELELSAVAPLPDDPVGWARLQLDEPSFSGEWLATRAGWRALRCETRAGGTATLLWLHEILEYGAAARLRCPEPLYHRHRDQVLEVLGAATVDWEGQPLTLAGIWAGY